MRRKLNQKQRAAFIAVFAVLVAALPFWVEIQHLPVYGLGMGGLLLWLVLEETLGERQGWEDKRRQKFRRRWSQARQRGYVYGMAQEAARGFVHMLLVVAFVQLAAHGRAPWDLVSRLADGGLTLVLLLLVIFSVAVGVAGWFENEKRYLEG